MGSVGSINSSVPSSRRDQEQTYNDIYNIEDAYDFFGDNQHSTTPNEWWDSLTEEERMAVTSYTGTSYGYMNRALYDTDWDDIDEYTKAELSNLYHALNKFELKEGIILTRKTSTLAFGLEKGATLDEVIEHLKDNNGIIQMDGFVSACADKNGLGVESSGVILTIQVPSGRHGAYVDPYSDNEGENEFIIQNNGIYQVDPQSVIQTADGTIHATLTLIDHAKDQSRKKKK